MVGHFWKDANGRSRTLGGAGWTLGGRWEKSVTLPSPKKHCENYNSSAAEFYTVPYSSKKLWIRYCTDT